MTEDKKAAPGRPGDAPANDPGEAADADFDFDFAIGDDEASAAAPEERLAAVEAELAETKDRLLRAIAETENTRRRFQRERDEVQKFAVTGFARDLLSS